MKKNIYVAGNSSIADVMLLHFDLSLYDIVPSIDTADVVVFCRESGEPFDSSELREYLSSSRLLVVLHGHTDPSDFLILLETGAVNFLTFPTTESHINSRILRVLSQPPVCSGGIKGTIDFSPSGISGEVSVNCRDIADFISSSLSNMIEQQSMIRTSLSPKGEIGALKSGIVDKTAAMNVKEKEILKEFLAASGEGRIVAYFHPVVSVQSGRISGFEALARWVHPEKGIISPDYFVPVAEKSGRIDVLTKCIVSNVVDTIAEWSRGCMLPENFRVSLNVSAKDFLSDDVTDFILSEVSRAGIKSSWIGIELTESAFMDDMAKANLNLLKLKKNKFTLYMDDFGTGYSSLSYLQHFPVDIIKVDKSFVKWMHIDDQSEHIVKSIIGLAHGLQMKVVAEGAEELRHFEMLKDMKCDYSQGYFHSKPISKDEAVVFLQSYCI